MINSKCLFTTKFKKDLLNLSQKQKNKYQLINSNLEIDKNEKLIFEIKLID